MDMQVAFCVLLIAFISVVGVAADEKSHLIPHGDNIILRCPQTSGMSRTDWAKVTGRSSTASYNRIVEDCVVIQGYKSLYDVTTEAVTVTIVCKLVIVNARKDHGGRYVCYDEHDRMSEALELSVLETNVIGSQSAVQAVGGDVVNYTCHILYHGDVSPSMTISPQPPQDLRVGIPYYVVGINSTISYDVTTMSVRVPDGPATVPAYTCRVDEKYVDQWSSVYFWKSTPITVSFCLKNVQITGAWNGSSVPGGTQLTCLAEAHPSASYTWTDDVSNAVVEGSTFRVVSMQYHNLTCTATNNITYADGRIESCTGSVYFQVDGFGTSSAEIVKLYLPFTLLAAVIIAAAVRLNL